MRQKFIHSTNQESKSSFSLKGLKPNINYRNTDMSATLSRLSTASNGSGAKRPATANKAGSSSKSRTIAVNVALPKDQLADNSTGQYLPLQSYPSNEYVFIVLLYS